MARKQVTCINKTNRSDYHDRIDNIGGSGWKYSTSEAIRYIEDKTHSFYVAKGGHEVNVIVASRNGRKYLKTENDGDSPDNLLSLPECR